MTPAKFLVVTAVGLSAAACSYSSTTTQAPAPVPVAATTTTTVYRSSSEQACMDYGFTPGTAAYNGCVTREANARAVGRMPATYTTTQLNADAQNACYSYGLTPGSASYNRCIGREVEARRYRQEAVVTPAPATYPAAAVYTTGNSSVTVTPAATTPPAGVQAFRDEYGFRYDGQGNRIDRNGNIISPQSTSP